MTLGIHATILIQMVNFFAAYWIIRLLLMKPAIKALEQERAFIQQLDCTIQTTQTANEAKTQTLERRWQNCRQTFALAVPDIKSAQRTLQEPLPINQVQIQELNKKAIDHMIIETALIIEKRLKHV